MAVTVVSGASGAFYYKPAGTIGTFAESSVNVSDNELKIEPFLGFRIGDPVGFDFINKQTGTASSGTLPSGLSTGTTYYVIAYNSTSGVLKVSETLGGSSVNITDDGTLVNPNVYRVAYEDFAAVGQVQSWDLTIAREEIDITIVGQQAGLQAKSRQYIPGLADVSGTAVVWVTDDDSTLGSRLSEDIVLSQQLGCTLKLYLDKKSTEAASRSITLEAVLTEVSRSVSPDDDQNIQITFRPSSSPDFDFSTTV